MKTLKNETKNNHDNKLEAGRAKTPVQRLVSCDDAWQKQRNKMLNNGMTPSATGYAKIAFFDAWVWDKKKIIKKSTVFGCFIECGNNGEPLPDCVIDKDLCGDCVCAVEGMEKESCEHWQSYEKVS